MAHTLRDEPRHSRGVRRAPRGANRSAPDPESPSRHSLCEVSQTPNRTHSALLRPVIVIECEADVSIERESGVDLSLTTRSAGQYEVIEVTGEIDVYTAPRLRERLIDLVNQGHHWLVVDIEKVEFLDSTRSEERRVGRQCKYRGD